MPTTPATEDDIEAATDELGAEIVAATFAAIQRLAELAGCSLHDAYDAITESVEALIEGAA